MDSKTTKKVGLIVLGLALLLVGWLAVRNHLPVAARPAEIAELAEQGEQLSRRLQEQLTERLENTPAHANQERLDSPMGQALLRQCLEWTGFYDNHPSDTTQQNREQACAAYADYIETGKEPE